MGENNLSIKTFKATLPEIVVTRNRNQSRWFGFLPNTFVTMVKPEKKKTKSSWRWVSPRTRLFTGNSVSQPILTGLGYVADATNKAISGLATSNTTPTGIYSVLSPLLMRTNQQVKLEVENTLNEKVWPTVMPSNYLTALFSEGSLNPYRGAEIKSTWSPTLLLLTVPLDIWASKKVGLGVGKAAEIPRLVVDKAAEAGFQPAKAAVIAREINLATKNKPNIEVLNPTKYNISDNITLYRANPTNIKNLSYKGERYGDTSGQYVGKWFTDESSKPNWYASNMAKRGEEPAYYLVTVPKYWAEKQRASHKISNPNIEYEPEDYVIEDGVNGLQGLLYQGRPGTIQYLLLNFLTPVIKEPSTSLKFFERRPSRISEAERAGKAKGLSYYTLEQNKAFLKLINDFAEKYGYTGLKDGEYSAEQLNSYARALIDKHNKFYRGVTLPTNKQDIALIKRVLGENATEDQILRYVATHTRGKNHPLWISPLSNAFIYGSNGKTAIISRPYKLGGDRTKWFLEGDFNIVETGRGGLDYSNFNGIVYPWLSPKFSAYNPFLKKRTYTEFSRNITPEDLKNSNYYLYMPNELVQNEYTVMNQPMIFRQWIKSKDAIDLSRKTPDTPWLLTDIVE